MVGSPEHDHVTLPSKRALFASSRLPLSFFSLSVFEMKEFFFQIALGGKFLNGVIENVTQYSLPELLTFWIVVTL